MTENKLAKIAQESGIEKTKAQYVLEQFQAFFEAASGWEKKASEIVITDVSQTEEMKLAKSARLNLKEIRVNAKKKHDELKAGILVEGKLIDGMYNIIAGVTQPIEASLLEKEKYIERLGAERVEKLRAERAEQIADLGVDPAPYPLGQMTEEAYMTLVDSFRMAKQLREDAARKAEEERKAREAAEAEERERKAREEAEERARIEAENARLKAEREERERQIAEERAKAEAERKAAEEAARLEREERERQIAEERAKAEAERKAAEEAARLEREERERKEAEERARHAEEMRKKEAEAEAARAELERIEREKREAEDAARKEKDRILAEEAEKARILAQAGDKGLMIDFLGRLLSVSPPAVKSVRARQIIECLREDLQGYVAEVELLDGGAK